MCLMGSKYCVWGEVGVEVLRFGLGDMEGGQAGNKVGKGRED